MTNEESSERLPPLQRAMRAIERMQSRLDELEAEKREPIAVIGMACRFPGGANDPASFWRMLREGRDGVRKVPADRWNVDETTPKDLPESARKALWWGGFLDGVDLFDAEFFGIAPREANAMDPQQRLLLETAHEALEDAGLDLDTLAGSRTGVFAGLVSTSIDYALEQCDNPAWVGAHSSTGTAHSIVPNRVSYLLDLQGPSVLVDTACSSSLVAMHLACQSLRTGDCETALAGGVHLILRPDSGIALSKLNFLSPEGRCKTFDAAGNGFVRGEGCGIVVLKRLSKAQKDGDRILAVIRGSAVNQDGASNGLTAPNPIPQQAMLRQALANAGLEPSDIGYIEAHGTGTELGDPIEVESLAEVLGDGPGECRLGAVKSNIGHLEGAAGVAGVIKAILCLRNRAIPKNLHYHKLNPHIRLEGTRLRVADEYREWNAAPNSRYCGVSSFGFGGTNAHVILGEAPEVERREKAESGKAWLLPLSARGEEALRALATSWAEFLADPARGAKMGPMDLAWTAGARRSHHGHRLTLTGRNTGDWLSALNALLAEKAAVDPIFSTVARVAPRVAFVFSGQGAQWAGMGRELYEKEKAFRDAIDAFDEAFLKMSGWSVREVALRGDDKFLEQTRVMQPALVATQIGLLALWRSWGIHPGAVVGHSVGEVSAAYAAGAVGLEDTARLIYHRARLMDRARGNGRMLAAGIGENEALEIMKAHSGKVFLAAVNGPRSVALSGDAASLERIRGELEKRNLFARALPVDYAFHCPAMAPHAEELERELIGLKATATETDFFSTVDGARKDGLDLGAKYWARNIRETVRFRDAMGAVLKSGVDAVVEISPHTVLAIPISECVEKAGGKAPALASMRRGQEARPILLESLGRLYCLGARVNWAAVNGDEEGRARQVDLPSYPWRRERYWLGMGDEAEARSDKAVPGETVHPLLGSRLSSPVCIFESIPSAGAPGFLGDHRFFGRSLLPGAAFVELGWAAGRLGLNESGMVELRDTLFQEPLFLPGNQAPSIQTVLREGDGGDRVFEVYSRDADAATWTRHAEARLRLGTNFSEPMPSLTPDFDSARGLCGIQVELADFYGKHEARGADFGPAFRTLRELFGGNKSALGRVELAPACDASGWLFHPALLDGCVQIAMAALEDASAEARATWLPFSMDLARFVKAPGASVLAYGRLDESRCDSQNLVCDIDIWAKSGGLCAALRGLRFRRTDRAGFRAKGGLALGSDLYRVEWEELPRVKAVHVASSTASYSHTWLVFGRASGLGRSFVDYVKSGPGGQRVVFVEDGKDFSGSLESGFRCCFETESDFDAVFESVNKSESHIAAVIYAPESIGPDFDLPAAESSAFCRGLLLLSRAVARADLEEFVFCVATRGAADMAGEAGTPSGAAPRGMARSLFRERPDWRGVLIDLSGQAPELDFERLALELSSRVANAAEGAWEPETDIALRGATRWGARLVHTTIPTSMSFERNRRLVVERMGTLDGLGFVEETRRIPGPGEVEIRVGATGLNFRDVLNVLGMYPGETPPLGNECAGIVERTGDGVSDLKPGDAVFGPVRDCFGRFAIGKAELLCRTPVGLGFSEAATIPVAFLTAWRSLFDHGRARSGESILVHSAAGGVGMAAVQLALGAGLTVYGTAGDKEKREAMRLLGCAGTFDSRSASFEKDLMTATQGGGVDIVLNSLGGDMISAGFRTLKLGGRFVEIGKRDIWSDERAKKEFPQVDYHVVFLDEVYEKDPSWARRTMGRIVEGLEKGLYRPLPFRSFPFDHCEGAFRHMAGARHIGKVVVTSEIWGATETGAIREDQTHLVTGGLGWLGLSVLEWLAERGARNLAVLDAMAPGEKAQAVLDKLKEQGVAVFSRKIDLADPETLRGAMDELDKTMPPLAGVLHLAGALDDGLLENLTIERFYKVFQGKAIGAWNLHQATEGIDLDYFVMFSGGVALLGNAGQSSYTAANAFLDGLATWRKSRGLPSLSVNWGAWSGGGMAVRTKGETGRDALTAQGYGKIDLMDGLEALEKLVFAPLSRIAVLPINWSRLGESMGGRLPALISRLTRPKADVVSPTVGVPKTESFLLNWSSAAADKRRSLLADHLASTASRVMGLGAGRKIRPSQPLQELGLDSLMAVELRNALARSLETKLPATLLFDYPSIEALVDFVGAKLLLSTRSGMGEVESAIQKTKKWKVEADVADLSDAEAEALLKAELDDLERNK